MKATWQRAAVGHVLREGNAIVGGIFQAAGAWTAHRIDGPGGGVMVPTQREAIAYVEAAIWYGPVAARLAATGHSVRRSRGA